MSGDKDIGWMYHGAKSDVNREDYLLGKRIDKNFEKYSDAVVEQRPDAIETVTKTRSVVRTKSSDHKVSALQKGVIKNEDPLVAVKVREELKRQEMLENPVMKMKFQKILKDMMEKKSKKKAKKEKKDKKKKKKTDSSEDDSSSSEKESSSRRSPSPVKRDKSPERSHRRRSRSSERRPAKQQHHRDSQTRRRDSSPQSSRRTSSNHHEKKREFQREKKPPVEPRRRRHDSSASPRRQKSPADDRLWKSRPTEKSPDVKRRRHDTRSPSPARKSSAHRKRHDSVERSRSPVRRRRHSTRSPSTKRRQSIERKHQDSSKRARSSTPEQKRRRHDSESPKRRSSPKRKTSRSRSRSPKKEKESSSEAGRAFDSHIPAHLRVPNAGGSDEEEGEEKPSHYDREENERKKKFEGYGLVGVKKKTDDDRVAENPYKLVKMPTVPVPAKKEKRRPMSDKEREERLKAMQENVEWRDAKRSSNMKRTAVEDEKEDEEEREKKAPSFIRAQISTATSELSMEQRLQSSKKSLQRSHDYMERKFTSR